LVIIYSYTSDARIHGRQTNHVSQYTDVKQTTYLNTRSSNKPRISIHGRQTNHVSQQ